jgi:membrane protein
MVVLLAFVTLSIALTGPVLDAVAEPIGLGGDVRTAWDVAKWPVLAVAVLLVMAILFSTTPNVHTGGLRRVMPGVVLALVVWLVASAGFALYVALFASYDKTYGTLGGVVVLLVWLWLTNVALLLGAELNAERERGRELAVGVPGAEREIQTAPRRAPGAPRTR